MKNNNVKVLLEALKKLRDDLHDDIDRSKLDELDRIILVLENESSISNNKCLELLSKAILAIPRIAGIIESLISNF